MCAVKLVILSADGDKMLYSVPDAAANGLDGYCMEFCTNWLWNSPHAEQYRRTRRNPDGTAFAYVSYTEADFIAWLNRWKFPSQPSFPAGRFDGDAPEPYRDCPRFDF